jgi:hypothetical protein
MEYTPTLVHQHKVYRPMKSEVELARRRKKGAIAETARLSALASYQVLDTEAEEEFDALTRLASYIARPPSL